LVEIEAGTARSGVDRETAHRRAAAELAVMERTVREKLGETTDPGPRVGGLLSEARAEVAEVGQLDAADAWSEAASRWAEGGFAWHRAGALARLGAVLLQQGERAEAAEALDECVAVASDIGAVPLEDWARELLRHAGLVDERGDEVDAGGLGRAAGGDAHLTAREMAVLELVADGRTNRQIGEELFMSPKTASVHVSRILQKLGVSNRTEAAAAARRAGLVA
jgi:DNA-binding CsgD family transcriptional regulator